MTAHELAKKLLDMPDVEVVYDDSMFGDMAFSFVKQGTYDDDGKTEVVRLM